MITGWRKDRQDTPFRSWQSRQANRIRNWISEETVQRFGQQPEDLPRARDQGDEAVHAGATGFSRRW